MKRSGRKDALTVVMLTVALLLSSVPPVLDAHTGDLKGKRVHPNPFREGQTVTFQLTVPRESKIKIDVYNLQGKHIRNLLGGETGVLHPPVEEAPVDWDGRDKYGASVPPGLYVCVLVSESTIVKSVKVVKI